MKRAYAQVQQENGTLVGEYLKRTNNHQELINSLKELNAMIRNASNLRVGASQKRVVALARDAIKNNTTK
jgi:Bardet-Biedl syndrome 2 protein